MKSVNCIIIIGLGLILASCQQPNQKLNSQEKPALENISFALANKKAIVYTTAEGTSERISPTDTIGFEAQPQPLETDVCVFVDPTHQFQKNYRLWWSIDGCRSRNICQDAKKYSG